MTSSAYAHPARIHVNRRDTLSAILVLALTAVALLAGYGLRVATEARTASYTAPNGITIAYPDTWVLEPAQSEVTVVRVSNVGAVDAPTTFEVRAQPVDAEADQQMALAATANDLALTRAQDMPVFDLFSIQGSQQIKGLPGAKSSYVFVHTEDDTMGATMPAVMLGEDYLAHTGDRIYIFTLHTAEANYAQALRRFEQFVAATTLP